MAEAQTPSEKEIHNLDAHTDVLKIPDDQESQEFEQRMQYYPEDVRKRVEAASERIITFPQYIKQTMHQVKEESQSISEYSDRKQLHRKAMQAISDAINFCNIYIAGTSSCNAQTLESIPEYSLLYTPDMIDALHTLYDMSDDISDFFFVAQQNYGGDLPGYVDFSMHLPAKENHKKVKETEEALPTSQDLLLAHQSRHWMSILGVGKLESRKTQLEREGKAKFTTGELNKDDQSELYPVYFDEGVSSRSGAGAIYGDVQFLFSKRQVLSKSSQYGYGDGMAVYDASYTSDGHVESGEGFSLDLGDEAFLMVIDEARAKGVVPIIKNVLKESEYWRKKNVDVDAWVDQHVLLIQDLDNKLYFEKDFQTQEAFRTQIQKRAEEKLFSQSTPPSLPEGVLIPSGAYTGVETHGKYFQGPLFQYKSNSAAGGS